MKRNSTKPPWLYASAGWIALLVLLAAWELYGTFTTYRSVTSFSTAAQSLVETLLSSALVDDILPSIGRVFAGFAIASVLGVSIGLLLGIFRKLDPWVMPVLEFFRATPPALIIPIAFLVLGLGTNLVVFIVAFGAFWPVLINTADGARRVEPLYIETAKALQLTSAERMFRIVVPAAIPTIMAGLRIALSMSLIMMVITEILASSNGIGYLLSLSQQTFNVPATYGGVLFLALLGWLFDSVFLLVERRVLRWHVSYQGAHNV